MSGYSDSAEVEASLAFQGVWLHDPLDPAGTLRQYRYGANSRDTAITVEGEANYFAGREAPVMDYGEHSQEVVSATIVVPHGPAYQEQVRELEDWARTRRLVHYRDNRGRTLAGALGSFRHNDQAHGTVCSFVITRMHTDTVEVI